MKAENFHSLRLEKKKTKNQKKIKKIEKGEK